MPNYQDPEMSQDMSQDMSQVPYVDENAVDEYMNPTELGSETEVNMVEYEEQAQSILIEYSKKIDLTPELDDDKLAEIGKKVITGFDEDKRSCSEWSMQVEEAQKLSKLAKEPKNYPLPRSANIKFPLITNACYQFAARTYPELIKDGKIVKAAIIGTDPTGEKEKLADRISRHMSYQLLYQSSEWEQLLDKLLVLLPNVGFLCKKTFFDPLQRRIRSVLCNYEDLFVNSEVAELKQARRISHCIRLHLNELIEGSRAGIYRKESVDKLVEKYKTDDLDPAIEIIEQHRYLDLDDDGYEEPYIVTVLKEDHQVIRIIARYTESDIRFNSSDEVTRIEPIHYFTDYHFLPSPDGKFHSMGFGTLMLHLNETINTILNQLIDSGTLANLRGGYIDARIKLPSGQSLHNPGEWKRVKTVGLIGIKEGIVPIEYREPSTVLYQLLSLLIQTGRDLSSATDVLSGKQQASRAPASTVATLVEQGLKIFNSIQRRLYRSMKDEFQKIFKLNKIYLDPYEYITILDDEFAIAQKDYANESIDILPIADPNFSSDAQRLVKVQAMMNIIDDPEVNRKEILTRFLKALDVSEPEKIIKPEDTNAPPPLEALELQGKFEESASKLDLEGRKVDLQEKQATVQMAKVKAEILKLEADTIKALADAESAEAGNQLDVYKSHLETLKTKLDMILKEKELDRNITQQIIDARNIEEDRKVQRVKNEAPPVS